MEVFNHKSDPITRSHVVSFLGYMLLFGGIFIFWFAIQDTRQAIEAQSWKGRKAQIISSNVFFNTSGGSRGWRLTIRGRFLEDGKEFETSRIRFGGIKINSKSNYEEYVAQYPPGTVHTVFVSPDNPTQIILQRNESAIIGNWPLLVSIGMIVISVLLLYISKKMP
ncbi:MAG: DUF3592 domain-containing protein [Thermodesulfobacteriota bacterium]|nr:DUF3592 domain-containing protein [Thermodesulfobacteriota bacterium]